MNYDLPVNYHSLEWWERREVRKQYIKEQNGNCAYCNQPLSSKPPKEITDRPINWELFPSNFLKYPIHLQHNHETGMTEGAVHSYCNAVMWQYEGR